MSYQGQTPPGPELGKVILSYLCRKINEISTMVWSKQTRRDKLNRAEKKANMDSRGSTGSDLDRVNSISSWITYDFSAICRRSLKILCIKNTAPSALQHQNLFICLRSCLLCFFSLTSSGADGFSAINQGPRKFTQSKCTARAGACHTHKDGAQLDRINQRGRGKKQHIICGAARESYIIRINCKVEILRNLNNFVD